MFEKITEIIGWLRIMAAPFLIPGGMGWAFYAYLSGVASFIVASLLTIAGAAIGVIWANRTWKNKGTIWFLSRTMATPELDEDASSQTQERSQ